MYESESKMLQDSLISHCDSLNPLKNKKTQHWMDVMILPDSKMTIWIDLPSCR